jgi:PBSX family phage terminase large subunit
MANDIKLIPAFLPIAQKKKRYKMMHGGRSSGKSVFVADFFLMTARTGKYRFLCAREIQKSLSQSVMSLLESRIEEHGWSAEFDILKNEIRHKYSGSVFIFSGLQSHTVDTIKSYADINYVWIEEAQSVSTRSLEVLIPTIRAEDSEIIMTFNRTDENDPCYALFKKEFETLTVKRTWETSDGKVLKWEEFETDDCIGIYANHDANPYMPEVLKKEMEKCRLKNIDDYNHIWLGQPRRNYENALWKPQWIENNRVFSTDGIQMSTIYVAIDPAATSSANSDETGIVVVGKARHAVETKVEDGKMKQETQWHYYVLADKSGIYTPLDWAKRSIALYNEYLANKIIAEKNQGGEMVSSNLRTVDRNIPIELVHATRGKAIRAEPVASLYEQGQVHHVGYFPELEKELTSWSPDEKWSPNHLDAVVWGIVGLMDKAGNGKKLKFII